MRKEHKPLLLKRWELWRDALYVNRILRPQFDVLGQHPFFYGPRTIKIAGPMISAGDNLHIISEHFKPVSLSTWSSKSNQGKIRIGHNCLISPGVNIASAQSIRIDDDCMIAADANISDCDWHGVYNRTRPFRCSADIHLKRNSWIGLRAIIGKGITVGENSIVAAGAVVVENVPDNCIVGGNPAKVIKQINPQRKMLRREFLFRKNQQSDDFYAKNQDELARFLFGDNSFYHWIRTKIAPGIND